MDNLKYSLKTQQFGKKRYHIFEKNLQKQSLSLEVHDPHHNVSHLIELNKSDEQSGLSETKKSSQLNNYIQQESKTVKFTKPNVKVPNISHIKQKNICHSINVTSKVKVPNNTQNPQPQQQNANKTNEDIIRPQLQVLKHVLYNNEQRLQKLVDSVNSLYKNTIELYNNHQRKLKQLVNSRCYQILKMFKSALLEIQRKQQSVYQIQSKVTILTNTLKDTKETLRITKIKQECIEALQKQEISILKNKLIQRQKSILKLDDFLNKDKFKQERSPRKPDSILFEVAKKDKDYVQDNQRLPKVSIANSSSPVRKTTRQFEFVSCSEIEAQSVSNFIDSPFNSLQLKQDDQKSPFEAHELYQISSTAPLHGPQVNTSKQSQYSFRKISKQPFMQTTQQSYSYINRNARSFSQAPIHKNSFKLRQILNSIPKSTLQRQIWIDNLNCLRRKNGTYIFDQFGNAVICTKEQLQEIFSDQL